jgi:hydrogenase nickel incorporation protein HypB
MIWQAWDLHHLDFLFIENVGNLVCPSSYDLGENLRLVLLSVTEARISRTSTPQFSTVMDLAPAVEFDWQCAYGNVQAVRPGMPVFQPLRQNWGRNGRISEFPDRPP